jgi:hypothetical protein
MEQMINEFERKKLLIQDDTEGLLVLANKMQSFLENKEENLEKLTDNLRKYPEVESEIVKFNVGGTQFATFKSTLTKKIRKPSNEDDDKKATSAAADNKVQYYEPHMLECMMNGMTKVMKDSNDVIFINRDPDYFKIILSYLRAIEDEEEFEFDACYNNSKSINKLIRETEHFNLMGLRDLLIRDFECSKSSILKENKLQLTFNKLIKDKAVFKILQYGHFKRWTLLYRATEDGFAAADFHRKCDNKGATLTIIKSKDHPNVFGGFTAVSWESPIKGHYKPDPTAFIFSLVNAENRPLLANCSDETKAIFCVSGNGPIFGGECNNRDICIFTNANTELDSYSNFPVSYKAVGFEEPSTRTQCFLAGSNKFYVSEIEVFQISFHE